MTRYKGFLFILASLLFQSLSIVFGKFASLHAETITWDSLIQNYYYFLSLGCLFLQALTWQQALRFYPLSWSYMFMSGVYPMIMIFSFFVFHEQVSLYNIAGTVIILTGIINLFRCRLNHD